MFGTTAPRLRSAPDGRRCDGLILPPPRIEILSAAPSAPAPNTLAPDTPSLAALSKTVTVLNRLRWWSRGEAPAKPLTTDKQRLFISASGPLCYPFVLAEASLRASDESGLSTHSPKHYLITMKPRVFIGSSVEQVDLAYAVQEGLEYDVEATVWTQGVFQPSRSTMAALVDQLDENDFAIFVLAPDDLTAMRKQVVSTVRDNVIFELGLFAGRFGHERCYLVTPRNADDLHLPTDLLGITPAEYDADRQDKNLVAALGAACNRIRKSIKQLGPRLPVQEVPIAPEVVEDDLTDDANDCISLIESWMGKRGASSNTSAIRFNDVDSALKLSPGSARKYIAQAAAKWGYVVDREGKDTIQFRSGSRSSMFY